MAFVRKSELVTGIFVLVGLLVGGALAIIPFNNFFSDSGKVQFVAYFDDVKLLQPKAQVAINGQPVGIVQSLEVVELDGAIPKESRIRVVFDVEDDVAGVRSATRLAARAKALGQAARKRLGRVSGPVRVTVDAEVRHTGQEHGVIVRYGPGVEARARARHRAEFGFDLADRPLEVVRLRARALADERRTRRRAAQEPRGRRVRGTRDAHGIEVVTRDDLAAGARVHGPARIEEPTATTWVPEGAVARVDARGVLHLDLGVGGGPR